MNEVDDPTRIAFLSEHASPAALLGGVDAGGQNVYVDEVSRHLAALGYAVDVVTRRDTPDAPEILEWAPGVRIINLVAGPEYFIPKDDLWPLMPEFRDAFLRFASSQNTHYNLIHGNFWMSGWVAIQLRQQLNIPVVQIFHATGKTKQRHQGTADTSPGERINIELQIVRHADRLIAQCPAERDELLDDYAADPHHIALIPSAVNIERFRPVEREEARRMIGIHPHEHVIAYVGRMIPRKDVRNLVRAFALVCERSLPHERAIGAAMDASVELTLLLVGGETSDPDPIGTPEIGVLQQLAADLGIAAHVRFIGKRQSDELRFYYSAADMVVTTPWYEPFGLTPLEAMACGRPVIGSAVGGIAYTIVHGKTGMLVPPGDPLALAGAIETLLAQPSLREEMGHAARKRVEHEFTWPVVARRTAALYEEVLAQS